jgi:prepilin peptidase CpaA
LFYPTFVLEGVLETTILLLGVALFAVAAYGDIKTLRIPNTLVCAVVALGVSRLTVNGDLSLALCTVSLSVLVFVIMFLLFWRGYVGGGDAKLITATALLVGYHSLFNFLAVMSLCGVVVTVVVLLTHRSSIVQSGEQPLPKARLAIPLVPQLLREVS